MLLRKRGVAICGILLSLVGGAARAEKEPLSPEELRETATHVVVGKVEQVFARQEKVNNYEYTRYVAEVRVDKLEKGDGLKPGELMYVRYWRRRWVGPGDSPVGSNGHRGLPSEGQAVRVYAVRNGYDGFGRTKDGGFNVVGTNGFEAIEETPDE
jgi:hypothetical protein